MKGLAWFLRIIETAGVLYLLGGIRIHSLILGEVSQTYYHNWAVGVAAGTFVVIFFCLLLLSLLNPRRARQEFVLSSIATLLLGLLGFLLSTGSYGGSFLRPQDFGFAIPGSLALIVLLGALARRRERSES
jgi:hypothetical protein